MKTTFLVKSWRNGSRLFTPAELLKRIIKDSASDYDWYAPASYLVKAINHRDFPVREASEIKILILNCFSNLMRKDIPRGNQLPGDSLAIQKCFNTLSSFYPRAHTAKERFLQSVIISVKKWFYQNLDWPSAGHSQQFLDDWRESVKESYQTFIDEKGNIDILEWEDWLKYSIEFHYHIYRQSEHEEYTGLTSQKFPVQYLKIVN